MSRADTAAILLHCERLAKEDVRKSYQSRMTTFWRALQSNSPEKSGGLEKPPSAANFSSNHGASEQSKASAEQNQTDPKPIDDNTNPLNTLPEDEIKWYWAQNERWRQEEVERKQEALRETLRQEKIHSEQQEQAFRRQAEEELRRQADEELRRQADEELRRQADEEHSRRRREAEEELRRQQAEELRRQADEERSRRRREAEEELRRQQAEEERLQEEIRADKEKLREEHMRQADEKMKAKERGMNLDQQFAFYCKTWENFHSKVTSKKPKPLSLGFTDIPWPVVLTKKSDITLNMTREATRHFFLHPDRIGRMDPATVVAKELLRWHPDKFHPAVLPLVQKKDVNRVKEQVNLITAFLSDMKKELSGSRWNKPQ